MNNLAVWAWMFLFGHLVWATGFMFLISWRGYWQELIETIVWAHERTPLANSLERQTSCFIYCSSTFSWFSSLYNRVYFHICTVCNRFHFRNLLFSSLYYIIFIKTIFIKKYGKRNA
jgi:hypothetical protein